jgi:hypothetical protein
MTIYRTLELELLKEETDLIKYEFYFKKSTEDGIIGLIVSSILSTNITLKASKCSSSSTGSANDA